MAINPAINNAAMANKAASVGFAQSVAAPNQTQRTQETNRVQVLDDQGLQETGQPNDSVEQKTLEHASGATSASRQQRTSETGRRHVEPRTEGKSILGGDEAGAGSGKAGKAKGQGETQPGADRALRAAFRDNSRQLQVQFSSARAASGEGQPLPTSPQAQKRVMLRNLESMVQQQLSQYTGNEPYTRSNYRQILGALGQMQAGMAPKTDRERDDRQEVTPSNSEGAYRLAEGQAARTLSFLNYVEPVRGDNEEPLDLVA